MVRMVDVLMASTYASECDLALLKVDGQDAPAKEVEAEHAINAGRDGKEWARTGKFVRVRPSASKAVTCSRGAYTIPLAVANGTAAGNSAGRTQPRSNRRKPIVVPDAPVSRRKTTRVGRRPD